MKSAAQMVESAAAWHQAGRFPDAEQAYLKILTTDPNNIDALRLLGGLYLQTGKPARAEHYLEKAAHARPDDAEILNNLGVALRNQGRLDEAATRYEQAVALKPDYHQAINNLGATSFERGKTDEAIALYKKSLLLNPDNPQAHYNLGNAFRVRGNFDEAVAHYEWALRLRPQYPDALVNLGLVFAEQGRLEEAKVRCEQALHLDSSNISVMNNYGNVLRQLGKAEEASVLYQRALHLKPDYIDAHINLGTVYRDMEKRNQSQRCYEQALRLNPDSPGALINMATLMTDFSRWEDAVDYYDRALRVLPDSPDAKWGKALALLALGKYREGWALYESGLNNRRARGFMRFNPAKCWDGQSFAGKRLLIWSEQGFGDALQFVRYAALCKPMGGEVVVLCPEPLARLFRNSPYIDRVVTAANDGDFDYHISMMSLPHALGTTLETVPAAVPYLHVDAEAKARWAPRFTDAEGPKVGLVWAGSPREQQLNAHLLDKRRSMSLALIKPLLDFSGACFYSLQMGKTAGQIDELGLRGRIADYMGDVKDFLDTAAIVENLDLVISVDTSVVHLVGALGKPVWVLSRFDACWRWLRNQESSPWYPTARIFGQPAPGEWQPVVDKVREALEKL